MTMTKLFLNSNKNATFSLSARYDFELISAAYDLIGRNNRLFQRYNKPSWFYGKHGKNGRYFSSARKFSHAFQPLSVAKSSNSNSNSNSNINGSINKSTKSPSNFVSVILKSLNDPNNTFKNNEDGKRSIENIVFEDYEFHYSANSTKFISGGIN